MTSTRTAVDPLPPILVAPDPSLGRRRLVAEMAVRNVGAVVALAAVSLAVVASAQDAKRQQATFVSEARACLERAREELDDLDIGGEVRAVAQERLDFLAPQGLDAGSYSARWRASPLYANAETFCIRVDGVVTAARNGH